MIRERRALPLEQQTLIRVGPAALTGRFGEVAIALLKRHGDGHHLSPAAVPYRANVYALKALGCTHLVASGATGSLRQEIAPGDLVLCDQLIDRTGGRERTFYERAACTWSSPTPAAPSCAGGSWARRRPSPR